MASRLARHGHRRRRQHRRRRPTTARGRHGDYFDAVARDDVDAALRRCGADGATARSTGSVDDVAPDGVARSSSELLAAIPDLRFEVLDVIAEDDTLRGPLAR